jgi:hypothetical protein
MIAVKHIASAVYGCIIGNWIENLFRTFSHRPGGEHRFVVVALTQNGEYIKVLETDTQSVAFDFECQIDDGTDTVNWLMFDRLMPGDKEDLQALEIMDTVPPDAEERDKLLAIIHEARKYW